MTEYEKFRNRHPELFVNHPDGIQITQESGLVVSDRFVTLVRDPVKFPDGSSGTYNRVYSTDLVQGAAVLPILPGGKVVLIEHFRHATRSWHWEIPRGFGTPGMTAKETAAQELSEEIGSQVRSMSFLGEVFSDTGILGQSVLLYAAEIDSVGSLDDHECIRDARTMTLEEAEKWVMAGMLSDGFSLAALYRYRLMRGR